MMLILTRSTRVDWPRMRENLRDLSDYALADLLSVSRSSLHNWTAADARGEPAHWTGTLFIEVWCKRTGLSWTDIPMRTVAPSVSSVLRATA